MDPKSPELMNAVMELRARALLEPPELHTQVKNALDAQYWRELNPRMAVCGTGQSESFERPGVGPAGAEGPLQMLSTSGYFQMPPIVADSLVNRMRSCFEATQAAGWHPTFCFVYDEFWRAFRGPTIVKFLIGALGEGYHQLPHCWGHYVAAGSKGWRPHVDGPTPIKKVTVWLPLNDATLENGCMYVVPRNNETRQISDQFWSKETFTVDDAVKLLQNSKALPAPAGSYLGWGPDLIHWGSTSNPRATPRISVSVEFACRPADPAGGSASLIDAHPSAPLPTFRKRLQVIATDIKSYEHFFDPGLLRHLPLVEKIIHETTSA
jgi:hypothetical protein